MLPHMTNRLAPVAASLAAVALLVGLAPAAVAAPPNFPSYDSGYHSYTEMVQVLQATAAAHPDIVHLFSIGTSYQGRALWAVKVSDNVMVDENEPEVMFDSLTHAREHLSLEQDLAILRWLTDGYGIDPRITHEVNTREIWIIFAVNPDGAEYDLTGSPYRAWRKNRQPNPGSTHIGTDLNRNYGYDWGCCGGSSGSTASITYRGPRAFSAPETQAMRDFMLSRRVGGVQQIKVAITFHTSGELVLWPYGHTKTNVPPDMTTADHAALATIGTRMAHRNGYHPMQSSDLYITDGDEIDWAYGTQRIWMYTLELYGRGPGVKEFYPPDEIITRETERNKEAILYLIDQAGCRYAAIGLAKQDCGPLFDDFEINAGWTVDPLHTDTSKSGRWARGNPATTPYQLGTTVSGSGALVTGAAAGSRPAANDVDGVTTVRSPLVSIPATTGRLTFRYSFAHASNSSSADDFRAYVERADGSRTLVTSIVGSARTLRPTWRSASISMAPWAGQDVRIVFEAADRGRGSTVEAEVDDVRITQP